MDDCGEDGWRRDWWERATCARVTPDLFVPECGELAGRTKRVCWECPVRQQCVVHAIVAGEDTGVWGATTPRERLLPLRRIGDRVSFENVAASVCLSVDAVQRIAEVQKTLSGRA
ncbi:WhiB family transcriptional regulator [Microbacterium sp. 13-71-7]|jgi:WhiB family redox-sensing transcriptional regulator|uniref:WhiB family transcriptional regulator n=1 Tax=Microbacterium sp. 13-71-7 TaxID=1970399 RepID=UPI000BDA00CF|nr:MAG: hypothetical protein B7X32_05105 [Microbacterium sp. 13-71-7]